MDQHTVRCEACGFSKMCTEGESCSEMTCPTCGIKMKCDTCGE